MKKYLKWVALALTIVWCLFIWQFSLSDAEQSSATSDPIVESVNGVLENINPNLEVTSEEVRKSAHFVEFMGLGALVALTLYLFGFPHIVPFGLIAVVLAATVDECLQFFSPGRAPSVVDALIDTAGGICGILGFLLVLYLVFAIMKRKEKKVSK